MFLRQLDLTTALRPSLFNDESLLFVQDGVGLYEGKYKIPAHQDGHAYLTSHRVCYVDNKEPRKCSVAVDLKDIERNEFYQGFLKSSPKITLFPKPVKKTALPIRSSLSSSLSSGNVTSSSGSHAGARSTPHSASTARNINATWICTICGLSNPVPAGFDPSTANEHTQLSPCQACGIKPSHVQMVKAAIAAMSNRASGPSLPVVPTLSSTNEEHNLDNRVGGHSTSNAASIQCQRCTFGNHPSLSSCEICGAPLPVFQEPASRSIAAEAGGRAESPAPTLATTSIIGNETIETIKFSFRAGGEKTFHDKLKGALVQRKWLLQSAPPLPRPSGLTLQATERAGTPERSSSPALSSQRVVGIAGLERRGAELRQNNQTVIGTAFEDLEALMTSAKEVIQMAEQFARQTNGGLDATSADARLISDSASALGLTTTKDMLGSGSAADQLYVTELSRDLAEFLTDDRNGVLRKEGGIVSLIDLWQIFNKKRNGIELVSPSDFEKAASRWDTLQLPVRLRRFKSGLLVVQEKSRTDEKTIASLVSWLREPQYAFPPPENDSISIAFGRGVTAQETAERFGWSVGVANEELEMAEETGALCRDQTLDGTRFWVNCLTDDANLQAHSSGTVH